MELVRANESTTLYDEIGALMLAFQKGLVQAQKEWPADSKTLVFLETVEPPTLASLYQRLHDVRSAIDQMEQTNQALQNAILLAETNFQQVEAEGGLFDQRLREVEGTKIPQIKALVSSVSVVSLANTTNNLNARVQALVPKVQSLCQREQEWMRKAEDLNARLQVFKQRKGFTF